eukprot:TRINITY_DN669_c0_g1_i1.p1 TRINITY_DN669_c0_g1~~TRINITY_DN669_c0_g1_i1.p1  ORF type:complete len:143 (+),score=17.43 TRINITY_DN669_c0_g1_i1:945-1373(+)
MRTTVCKVKVTEKDISERIKDSLHPNKPTTNLLPPRATTHSIPQLLGEDDILKDSIHHSDVDIEYLEQREKRLRGQSVFSLPKKYACHTEGARSTRSYATFQLPEIAVPNELKLLPYAYVNCQVCGEDPCTCLLYTSPSPRD